MPERRKLTPGEVDLARSIYGSAIDLGTVEIRREKWWPFQPKSVVMAPRGHIHFHPKTEMWRDDFSDASLSLQRLLIHELCHVWQTQQGIFLPLKRHPFCRYAYTFVPGKPFTAYGIEQQAEIVAHTFLAMRGAPLAESPPLADLRELLPFPLA